jgi:hypothetical protein
MKNEEFLIDNSTLEAETTELSRNVGNQTSNEQEGKNLLLRVSMKYVV